MLLLFPVSSVLLIEELLDGKFFNRIDRKNFYKFGLISAISRFGTENVPLDDSKLILDKNRYVRLRHGSLIGTKLYLNDQRIPQQGD